MDSWLLNKVVSKKLPVLMSWFIWKEHNKVLFEGKSPSAWVVIYKILGVLIKKPIAFNSQALRPSPIFRLNGYTLAYFDGASIAGGSNCGAGGSLKCLGFRWYFNCGE
jgi:hypothetical protein